MNRLSFIFILLFLVLLTSQAQTNSSLAQNHTVEWNKEAKYFHQKGEYKKAVALYLEAIQSHKSEREDIRYAVLLKELAETYFQLGLYPKADSLYQTTYTLLQKKKESHTLEYLQTLNKWAAFKNEMRKLPEAEALLREAIQLGKEKSLETHPVYAESLIELAASSLEAYKLEEAEELLIEALEIFPTDSLSSAAVRALVVLGNYCLSNSNLQEAEEMYTLATKMSKLIHGEFHPEYVRNLTNLIVLYEQKGEYQKSLQIYDQILPVKKHFFSEDHPLFIDLYCIMANVYYGTGELKKTETTLKRVLEASLKRLDEEHSTYFTAINTLGVLYTDIGEYTKAEPLLLKSLKIRKELFGDSNVRVYITLIHLGNLYSSFGNYTQAEYYYREALAVTKVDKLSYENRYSVLLCLGQTALRTGFQERAIALFEEASEIQKQRFGENHPEYLTSLSVMAEAFDVPVYGNDSIAENMYLKILHNRKEVLGDKHPDYFLTVNKLVLFYQSRGQYEKMQNLYTQLTGFLETLSPDHHMYLPLLNNIACAQEMVGEYDKAKTNLIKSFDQLKEYARKNLSTLSEQEREMIWDKMSDNLGYFKYFSGKYKDTDASISSLAYDCELFSKSILLNSNQQVQRALIESGDEYLLALWESMKKVKEYVTRMDEIIKGLDKEFASTFLLSPSIDIYEFLLALNNQELIESYETDMLPLKKEREEYNAFIHQTEKEMFTHSLAGIQHLQNFSIGWEDVKKSLKDNQLAIEFIQYAESDFKLGGFEGNQYYALLVGPTSEYPEMIYLCNEYELKAAMEESRYGSKVYKLIWGPISRYLKGVTNVYIAPCGLLNGISFAALKHKSQYLSDKYTIHNLLSTKDILNIGINEHKALSENTALLLGGADFGLMPEDLVSIDSADRGQGFSYLAGSKKEVQVIEKLLLEQKWKVSLLVGNEASESNFKSLSTLLSPTVVHISTHGFYFPLYDYEKDPRDDEGNAIFPEKENIYEKSDNPLLRSGLAFSGANQVWRGEEVSIDEEDGVLTAYEVANLNLANTKLVVLSACETGLGDMIGSEGIYGLQRAFRLAGAQHLIVSLWSVPDAETEKLMTRFYSHWLNGADIRTAFSNAQKELKKEHPEPEKWAGFILIE